ncbi:TetR/AcrR family transcriptional regulator [Streptomyces griseoaurantiacus]|uniref:TetR/AcrR family transcriptional regulator n=1 Tax=Streptomyces griseoaurantiacus TaxID=68213 RepID=UPI003460FD5C
MPTAARPARVDAVRNRALLLAAAEAEFAERGLDVSIADIAHRAGVAKGTVFRHFATKDALVAAVAGDRLARLVAVARSLADAPDSGAALREFLSATAEILQHQGLTFLRTVSECAPVVAEIHDRLLASAGVLVDRARRDGLVRPDVTGADVLLLTCATVHTVGALSEPGSDLWRRYLTIVVDGLRPEGASPLPRPAPERLRPSPLPQGAS